MNHKLRILFAGEASYTLSGFGTYSKELISRLFETGKYEIAEFANYGFINDPRDKDVPWRIYPNAIRPDDPRINLYNDKPINQFGAWRFERVILDFKPDIVAAWTDPWMMIYQNNTPLRKFFHWAISPTVDSSPQQEEWIDNFAKADGVLTYSDFGYDTLLKEGGGLIKLYKANPPGVDTDVFKPVFNKLEHRRKLGFPEDLLIVGTIMRNQRRKLFPDLMVAFNLYLDKCYANGRKDLADKSFLYFHTSYPDVKGCWNLPRLIKENGLGHKILFTYMCQNCKSIFAACFQDAKTVCPRCHSVAATLPSVGYGLSRQQLSDVYNIFDVFAQYATNEGAGMPQIEAAACGVPDMATDYSAMNDIVRKLHGYPIKVGRLFRTVEEDAYKALPDNDDMANKLFKFFTQPLSKRIELGHKARGGVEQHYTWDKNAKIWEEYFDHIKLTGQQGKWDSTPPSLIQEPRVDKIPDNLDNEQFVNWAIVNILQDPSYLNTLMAIDMVRALNYEHIIAVDHSPMPYNRNDVIKKFEGMINNHNQCEQARCGLLPLPPEDYIEYAHNRWP